MEMWYGCLTVPLPLVTGHCSICWRRLHQTPEGRYYIGSTGGPCQIPYLTAERRQVQLSDLPSKYAQKHISDACPSNTLLPDFIPQLQPHLILTGKQALFKLQLTHLQDGSVLGISFSHSLSGPNKLISLCTKALPGSDIAPCKGVCQALPYFISH